MFANHNVEAIVVEDDALSNEALCSSLESIGITAVRSAKTGAQALQFIKEHSEVDFIVLDVYMPDMDGIEIIKVLNDLNFKGGLILNSGDEKILQLSAKLGRAYHLDVWAALFKPFSLDSLIQVLRTNMNLPSH